MQLPNLTIGNITAKLPIIQGGMAIRISTAKLAGAVALSGGIGVIGASGMELDELRKEIREAKRIAPKGIVGVNIMFVAREFWNLVKTSIEEKIDIIITGAGFSRDIFKIGKETNTPIATIVSSAKLAALAVKSGASAIIIEGKEAGGHLGTLTQSAKDILPDVLKVAKDIPVIVAGGVTSGREIVEFIRLGASGVQMATRFILTPECNAPDNYKETVLKANKEDIVIIQSPVGLPGRAVRNTFSEKILAGSAPKPKMCDHCLKHCNYNFCIFEALKQAQTGNLDEGLVFSGEMAYKYNEILPTKTIMENLVKEAEAVA